MSSAHAFVILATLIFVLPTFLLALIAAYKAEQARKGTEILPHKIETLEKLIMVSGSGSASTNAPKT